MYNQESLKKLASWTGFVGIITLILGILQAITIVGIIPGVLCIILGVKLMGAKSSARALGAGDQTPEHLNKMITDLGTYFQINGILIILSLILGVVGIIVGIIVGITSYNSIPWDDYMHLTRLLMA
jgi:hypothetical protein